MSVNNKIKIRRGLNSNLPSSGTVEGELRYSTDTKELYIDDGTNNVKIGGSPVDFPVSTAQQTALDLKADQSTTYTKTEVDTLKVAKTDIVDNLTSTDATKVLSANMGREIDEKKADVLQEDWIEATLLNGNETNGINTVAFFKDSFNIVRCKGIIDTTNRTLELALILPVGYRRGQVYSIRVVSTNIADNGARVFININGDLEIKNVTTGTSVYLDGISFRAEA